MQRDTDIIRKEQIEEMANDIVRSASLGAYEKAKYLTDLGYRKIPENAVVLTNQRCILANKVYSDTTLKGWKKEELIEHIRILEHNWASAEKCIDNQVKNFKMLLKQAQKETAKEILNDLYYNLQVSEQGKISKSNDYYNVDGWIKEIAKEYGEEAEE